MRPPLRQLLLGGALTLPLLGCPAPPTTIELTLSGDGFTGGTLPPTLLRVQLFNPNAGEFGEEVELLATNGTGIFLEGETVELSLNIPAGEFPIDLAAGLVDSNQRTLSAARTSLTLRSNQANRVALVLAPPTCGDGFVDEDLDSLELCDDVGQVGGCPDNCRLGVCGDEIFDEIVEQCDQGERNGLLGSGCDEECLLSPALLFGARAVPVSPGPLRPLVIPSGPGGVPEPALLDLAGGAQLVPLLGQVVEPLGTPQPLVVFPRVDALDAADLDADGLPELVALDRAASTLRIAGRPGGAPVLLAELALQDPLDASPLLVDRAVLLPNANTASLVLAEADELWIAPQSGIGFDLAAAARIPLPEPVRGLLVAELSGDGRPDLAVQLAQQVLVFTGEDAPSPTPANTLDCGDDGASAALLDLDALTLAGASSLLATREDGRLCLFALDGTGRSTRDVVAPSALSAAVLNDGDELRVALASPDERGRELVYTGFAAPTLRREFGLLRDAGQLASLDLDGDGARDLLAASPAAGELHAFLRDAAGELSVPSLSAPLTAPVAMTLADLNRDGFQDLLGAAPGALLVMDGPGFSATREFPGLATPTAITSFDRDVDGAPDVVIPDGERLRFFFGDGAGGIASEEDFLPGGIFGPTDIAVGEMDGSDGLDWGVVYDDLSGPSARDGGLLLYRDVLGAPPAPEELGVGGLGAVVVEAQDLTFDRRRDLIVPLRETNAVTLTSLVDTPPLTATFALEVPCGPVAALVGDGDQNIFPEVFIFCADEPRMFILRDAGLVALPIEERPFVRVAAAALLDLNGDRKTDLVALADDGRMAVMLNAGEDPRDDSSGALFFSEPFFFPAGELPAALVAGVVGGRPSLFFSDRTGVIGRWTVAP